MQDAADVKQIRQGRYKAKVIMQGRLYFREKVKAGNAKKSAGRLSDTTLKKQIIRSWHSGATLSKAG